MNWQKEIKKELLRLKISQTELEIEALKVKLHRLRFQAEEYDNNQEEDISVDSGIGGDDSIVEGISLGTVDRDGREISTGDRVELLTPSKNDNTFKKGNDGVKVEGLQGSFVKGRLISDPKKKTKRFGKNLRIVEKVKKSLTK